ncbi:MAG: sulfotransferase, partial [Phycisphaerales bacterium]|nr:sulfotransferase [Phycisphaerales bacterium]
MATPTRFIYVCGMSRSGTTLVATMLDAHPDISMGYELLPAELPNATALLAALAEAIAASDGSARKVGNFLKDRGMATAGVFVKRAARALVEPDELIGIIQTMQAEGTERLDDMRARRALSRAVVCAKMEREQTSIGGHKIGTDLAKAVLDEESSSVVLFVIRDPRDVTASQRARGFDHDLPTIARTWNKLVDQAMKLTRSMPDRCAIVQYEQIVRAPEVTLRTLAPTIGVGIVPEMLEFSTSKASVLTSAVRHANADNLAKDLFTTSIGRSATELSDGDRRQLAKIC